MRYDVTLKSIFRSPPQRLLRLLTGQEASEILPSEFASVRKRWPDLVVRLLDGTVFHAELQSSHDPDMPWRMLEYYALIRGAYPEAPLLQTLLYVGEEPPRFTTIIEERSLRFYYTVRDIREFDCADMLESPCLEESLLAILCRMADPQATIRHLLGRIALQPPKARADSLEKLVILGGLRRLVPTIHEEKSEMAIQVNVMENEFLRDIFMDGRQEGQQEGRQEGRQEEGVTLLQRLLQHRFGRLPPWVEEKLRQAPLEVVRRWCEQVLDARTLDEVFK